MKRDLARWIAACAALLTLAGPLPARATGYLDDWHPYQTYWAPGWSAAVPLTSLRANYVSNTGWLGGGFDVRAGIVGRLAVGVSGTWNYFDQTFPFLTVEQPDVTFTGPVFRRLNTFTALLTFHYYLTQTAIQPFVGVGVGGIWATARQQVVNRSNDSYNSGLAAAAEFGFLLNVAPRFAVFASARYQVGLTTFAQVSNPQWVAGQAGVAFLY